MKSETITLKSIWKRRDFMVLKNKIILLKYIKIPLTHDALTSEMEIIIIFFFSSNQHDQYQRLIKMPKRIFTLLLEYFMDRLSQMTYVALIFDSHVNDIENDY